MESLLTVEPGEATRTRARTRTGTMLHLHIPKSAGTTFQTVLEKVYKPYTYCSIYPNWAGAVETIRSIAWEGPLQAMVGHFPYGLHLVAGARAFMDDVFCYTTILRDPVDRVVSLYNYLMNSDYPGHREMIEKHPTLERFLEHPWSRDVQACYLTNWHRAVIKDDKPAAVRVATQRLRDEFAVVGLTDRFDESLILFAEAFGWDLPTYTARNQASDRVRRIHVDDLSRSLVDQIRSVNRCDVPIQEFALALFEERRAAVPSFDAKLADYRIRLTAAAAVE